jgi:hypothetical protein
MRVPSGRFKKRILLVDDPISTRCKDRPPSFGRLNDEDRDFLDEIVKVVRRVPARTEIISEGDALSDVHLR